MESARVDRQWMRSTNCLPNTVRTHCFQYYLHGIGISDLSYTNLPTVDSLNYLGSTMQAEGGCEKDVTNRIRAGRNRCGDMSGVICDKKVPEVYL